MIFIFWWKKYKHSWIATAISFVGAVILPFASICTDFVLVMQVDKYITSNTTVFGVLLVTLFVAFFIIGKILLNKLTDKIALKSYNRQNITQ